MSEADVYLAVGDSLTAGYAVGPNHSFASLFSAFLASRLSGLRYINLGRNGLTTGGLAGMAVNNPQVRNLLSRAKVISITIGSNDLLGPGLKLIKDGPFNLPAVLTKMAANLEVIGRQIRLLNRKALVLVAGIYNPLPAGAFPGYASQAQTIIDQANLLLLAWAKKFAFRLVPLDRIFKGREGFLLGRDRLHPGFPGHQAIAAGFIRIWLQGQRTVFSRNPRWDFLKGA
ncbi:MAG TPA: GDSL-type esterase/lipase family protein [Desulfitobacteriaceae bacterium]|nr:GDSL-type esterase/lipase family protein [Desulfitobacteriaceae bacterium]